MFLIKQGTIAALCALGMSTLLAGLPVSVAAPADDLHAQAADTVVAAYPIVETDPMPHNGDAADDPAIWIHPSDPAQSTIIGTDKRGGIAVYGLDGRQIQYRADGKMNNVDLRYNFSLANQRIALVTATNQSGNSIAVYRVNPDTRQLENVAARTISAGMNVYGTCMYRSPRTGKYYVFVTKSPYPLNDPKANSGEVRQFELFDRGGKVDARQVRSFKVGSDSEGCVADDVTGRLYVAETRIGIWEYGAEPGDGSARTSVARVGDGHLERELEGLALYYTGQNTGYLIASEQCCAKFAMYRREGSHAFVGHFAIKENSAAGIDNVSGTDGIDVTNFPLGSSFSGGMFVAHDTKNDPGASSYTNFKLVPWESIAQAFAPPLTIDTSWDPRQVGGSSTAITPINTATATSMPAPTSTPINMATNTPTSTATAINTATATATSTPTSTATPTATSMPAPTSTTTPTSTATLTPTAVNEPPGTSVPTVPASTQPAIWLPLLTR